MGTTATAEITAVTDATHVTTTTATAVKATTIPRYYEHVYTAIAPTTTIVKTSH